MFLLIWRLLTLSHYLDLLSGCGLLTGLQKYAQKPIRQKGSSPKFSVFNTALMTSQTGLTYHEAKQNSSFWGHLVESAVGAHILNNIKGTLIEVFYWRERDKEIDFVLKLGQTITAIEVKSNGGSLKKTGMDEFIREHKPQRILLLGEKGLSLEEFFSKPLISFFS